jgi:hypothetical protein
MPMQRRVFASLAFAIVPCLAGCGSTALWQLGFGSGKGFVVERVQPRGPFLEVDLSGGFALRTYVPPSEDCAFVLAPEKKITYVERGSGRFEREDRACDAAGIGEPNISRGRQPRSSAPGSSAIPRAQATFGVLYEDADVLLLRGRFPLAHLVGWAGGADSVAVVPNEENCQGAITGGVASMEYRASGRISLALVGPGGLCPIVGLIRPPS